MANIKDLKVRIRSTKNTFKITSAMKLVSAAKLSRAQSKITGFRPYSSELDRTIRIAAALTSSYTHKFLQENDSKQSALLVISSEKGLCGGYNGQLYKKVKSFLNNTDEDVKVYFIGKKVKELLKAKETFNEGKTYTFEKVEPTFEEIKAVATELAEQFTSAEVGKVHVAYNSFISALEFDSRVSQVLPMNVSEAEKDKLREEFPTDFKYEPSPAAILDSLIPESFNTYLFTCILDATAAEHGSRMTAMENASKNCNEMIRNLTLQMNKLRQAAITTELTEIVAGAESLNS
jgi:F-type H+-transporting ATPase subunit gamma